jgi:hypothetical protein
MVEGLTDQELVFSVMIIFFVLIPFFAFALAVLHSPTKMIDIFQND